MPVSSPSNSPPFLFATTRGNTPAHRGYLAVFALTPEGLLAAPPSRTSASAANHVTSSSNYLGEAEVEPVERYETPTSGGKANAIEIAPYSISSSYSSVGTTDSDGVEWIVLTDDEQGYVLVLEWSANREGGSFKELSRVQLDEGSLASHAIWLA